MEHANYERKKARMHRRKKKKKNGAPLVDLSPASSEYTTQVRPKMDARPRSRDAAAAAAAFLYLGLEFAQSYRSPTSINYQIKRTPAFQKAYNAIPGNTTRERAVLYLGARVELYQVRRKLATTPRCFDFRVVIFKIHIHSGNVYWRKIGRSRVRGVYEAPDSRHKQTHEFFRATMEGEEGDLGSSRSASKRRVAALTAPERRTRSSRREMINRCLFDYRTSVDLLT